MVRTARITIGLILGGVLLSGQTTPQQKQLNIDSFEAVWTTIRDKHWEKNPAGLDWQAIHEEFRPRIDKAGSTDEVRSILREMLGRLHQTHFAIVPAPLYSVVGGDAVSDHSLGDVGGSGWPGFDVRMLDGHVIVTDAAPDSEVKPGWEVISAGRVDFPPLIEKLQADGSIHELALERAITTLIAGPVGQRKTFVLRTGRDTAGLTLTFREPRGNLAGFGNLPPQHVWFEARRVGEQKEIGYIRFNWFLDLVRVMDQFGKAVEDCRSCAGLVIDLRGNPGGIGAMAMGMAGWLVDKPDLRLGTMYLRGAELKFTINPRAGAYLGPVAILVDGSSGSTAEIFAGGLKDLGRARVFGTKTAAAALPSVFTRLPNGDGFQYAIANYISEGGKALEGNGVIPDVEVKLTRDGLLAGHDAVLDAAIDWIRGSKK